MTMLLRRLSPRLYRALVAIACLVGLVTLVRAADYQIQAQALPDRILFGQGTKATITVTVHDMQGRPVPDGTQVSFFTTLGTLPSIAFTQHGVVSVMLDNNTGPGEAHIEITVGNDRAVLTVEYMAQNGEQVVTPKNHRPSYKLSAKRIEYSADRRIFDLRDAASFTTPTFTVAADAIQFDLKRSVLTAQYNVTLTAGKQVIVADRLYLDMSGNSGASIKVDPDLVQEHFSLPSLKPLDDTGSQTTDFTPIVTRPTHTWILCSAATIYPGEEIHFIHPHFYVDGFDHALLILPYHVLNLRSSCDATFFNSALSLTSTTGLNVDFPVYFTANDYQTGAIHLSTVTEGSTNYHGSTGLQVGVEEDYHAGADGLGSLNLNDLTRETRCISWNHNQTIDNTHLSLSASCDRYTDDTPYTTHLSLSANRMLHGSMLSMTNNWSYFPGNQYTYSELTDALPAIPIWHARFRLGFSPYVGFNQQISSSSDGTSTTSQSTLYEGLRTGLSFPTLGLLHGSLVTNLSNDLEHLPDNLYTNNFLTSVGYQKRLTKVFSTSLNYSFGLMTSNGTPGDPYGGFVTSKPTQNLSASFYGSKLQHWDLYAYAMYDIGNRTTSASTRATYYLPWDRRRNGAPNWSFLYNNSLTIGQGLQMIDHQFAIGRYISNYQLILYYSPNGNTGITGLGSSSGGNWSIQLVRQGW